MTTLEGLIFGDDWWDWKRGEPTPGMLTSLSNCYGPREQLDQLDRLKKSLKKAGVDQEQPWAKRTVGATYEDYLDAAWLNVHARRVGASTEFSRRSESFLERTKVVDATDPIQGKRESWALQEMEGVVRDAGNTENWKRMRLGVSIDAMYTFVKAVATADTTVLDLSSDTCQFMAEKYQNQAENSATRLGEQIDEDDYFAGMTAGQAGTFYGPMSSMGCVKGVPARFHDADEVVIFIEGAIARYKENPLKTDYGIDCKPMVDGMQSMVTSLEQIRQYGTMSEPQFVDLMLMQYTNAVGLGCYAEF